MEKTRGNQRSSQVTSGSKSAAIEKPRIKSPIGREKSHSPARRPIPITRAIALELVDHHQDLEGSLWGSGMVFNVPLWKIANEPGYPGKRPILGTCVNCNKQNRDGSILMRHQLAIEILLNPIVDKPLEAEYPICRDRMILF